MRLVEELICLVKAVRNPVCGIVRHVAFGHGNLDVRLVAYPPASVVCEELTGLDKLHLNSRYLHAFAEWNQDKVCCDVRSNNIILLRDSDFIGELIRPDILIDLLHGHRLEQVAAKGANNADVRSGRELLAHIASIHGRLEVVDDPVGRQPLDALVEVVGHLEAKVPLMVAGVDFVCLVLARIVGE